MSAIDAVYNAAPIDDAGAVTADLYDWQASMAAAEGLALMLDAMSTGVELDPSITASITCEVHEDWVVRWNDDVEIVSAKHREPASGPWNTITVLVVDGGVGHLFSRWVLLDRVVTARLVTCAALTGDAKALGECKDLLARIEEGEELSADELKSLETCLDLLARALMMYRKNLPSVWQAAEGARAKALVVPSDLAQAVRAFVRVLRMDEVRPTRLVVAHAAPSMYAAPVVSRLDQHSSLSVPVWEAVVGLFRQRMRAHGPTRTGGLPMTSATTTSNQDQLNPDLEARIVTVDDVLIAVKAALVSPEGFLPISQPPRLTKLGMKMARGGCSPTSISRAEMLRIAYSDYRRERRSVPGSVAAQRIAELQLLKLADEATGEVQRPGIHWGATLWQRLSTDLSDKPPAALSDTGLDADLALGGISDLASRCKVWFSSYFDVNAAIAAAKAERDSK